MSDRLLVIGGTGMIGHRLVLEAAPRVETFWTARGDGAVALGVLPMDRRVPGVDVASAERLREVVSRLRPTAVVNCAGTVKQRTDAGDATMIRANALFPHELADACDTAGARLVHISTDCVFSGAEGDRPNGYAESDPPDAADLYGRSKLLGEVVRPGHVTLRTSMIGPELSRHSGLLDWFLRAGEPLKGYARSRFSGLTTPALARVLLELAFSHRGVDGLFHLAGPPIDKLSLLSLLRERLRPGVEIRGDDEVRIDRRLDGRRLVGATGIRVPSWVEMLDELAEEIRARKGPA